MTKRNDETKMVTTRMVIKVLNTRFPVAVHILALLAVNSGEYIKSEDIAKSVNTNPVVIRRIAGLLKKAGFIEIRSGVGGATLLKNADEISLFDVYCAVNPDEGSHLFVLHENPNPMCYIGNNIHDALEMPLSITEQAFRKSLSSTSISDISAFIEARRDRGYLRVYYSK